MPSATTLNLDALNGNWIDFYSLLDLTPEAAEDAIRKRISVRYSEAIANYNHRDPKRRDYYQILGQQVIPQCRRILLNPEFREWYDCQNTLHSSGEAGALDYKTFLTTLHEDGVPSTPDAANDTSGADATPATSASVAPTSVASEASVSAASVVEAIKVEAIEVAPEAASEAAPVTASAATYVMTEAPEVPEDEPIYQTPSTPLVEDKHYLTPTSLDEPMPVMPMVQGPSLAQKASLRPPAPTGPTSFIQDNLATPRSVQKAVKQATKAKTRKAAAANLPAYTPRVSVDNVLAVSASGLFRHGERALSDTSIALLTAIVATMLSITIDYFAMPGFAELTGVGFAVMQSPKLTKFVPHPTAAPHRYQQHTTKRHQKS